MFIIQITLSKLHYQPYLLQQIYNPSSVIHFFVDLIFLLSNMSVLDHFKIKLISLQRDLGGSLRRIIKIAYLYKYHYQIIFILQPVQIQDEFQIWIYYLSQYRMSKQPPAQSIIRDSLEQKLSLARSLLEDNVTKAIPIYKKVLFLNQSADVLLQLAACYEKIYDTSTAMTLYRRAQQLKPNCTNKIRELAMIRGYNLVMAGSCKSLLYETQFQEFEPCFQRFKSHLLNFGKDQQILRALCFLQLNYRVFAKQQMKDLNFIYHVLLLGYINLSLGNKIQSYRLFWKAYDIEKDNVYVVDVYNIIQPQIKALYKQTQMLLIQGKLQKCAMNIKKGLQMDAFNNQFLILKAYLHRTKGQYQQALSTLELANSYLKNQSEKENLYNQMALVYNQIGRMYFQQDNLEDAIDLFNKAIKFKPEDWAAKVNRGDCYKNLGEYDKAINDYSSAYSLQAIPEIGHRIAMTLNSRGIAYFNNGDYDQAYIDFSSAIDKSHNSRFYFNRGKALLQLQKFSDALHDFETVLQLQPTHAQALSYIIQHRKK